MGPGERSRPLERRDAGRALGEGSAATRRKHTHTQAKWRKEGKDTLVPQERIRDEE